MRESEAAGVAQRRYGLGDNVALLLRWMARICGPRALAVSVLDVVVGVAQPFLAAALPSVVVAALTSGAEPLAALALVAGAAALLQALVVLKTWAGAKSNWNYMLTRVWGGFDLCRDALAADYRYIEGDEAHKKLDLATRAFFNDNSMGVEEALRRLFAALTGALGMVAYAVTIGVRVTWLLVPLVLLTAASIAANRRANEKGYAVMDDEFAASEAFEYLRRQALDPANGKDIRLYRMAAWFRRAFAQVIEKNVVLRNVEYGAFERAEYVAAACALVRDGVSYAALIALLFTGAIDLPAFLLLAGMVSGFGTWMQTAFDSLSELTIQLRHVSTYRDVHEDCRPTARGTAPAPNPGHAHEICLDHVSFSYDGRADALCDLTLTIRPGEKIALVGVNGAGKTTLVKLLCGLYRPTSGTVYLDGVDMASIDPTSLWREFSVVFQDCFPFSFNVADNVTCAAGEKDVDAARLAACLAQADLAEKVASLPHGADTYLGQDVDPEGVSLSGGETQRLMLARALYKGAPVVLLDEPTAALDPLAERQMYERYDELTHGRTSVFISHRLSSTRFCERILFLEGGRVTEQGTHDELMAAGGGYARMFETQARYYEDDPIGDRTLLAHGPDGPKVSCPQLGHEGGDDDAE